MSAVRARARSGACSAAVRFQVPGHGAGGHEREAVAEHRAVTLAPPGRVSEDNKTAGSSIACG